jgi:hypothetical protein
LKESFYSLLVLKSITELAKRKRLYANQYSQVEFGTSMAKGKAEAVNTGRKNAGRRKVRTWKCTWDWSFVSHDSLNFF